MAVPTANIGFQNQSTTTRVNAGPAGRTEQGLQRGQLDLIEMLKNLAGSDALGGLGEQIAQLTQQLQGGVGDLASVKTVGGFLTGDDPSLVKKSRELSQPIIANARAEIDDFLNAFAGKAAVGSASSGVGGSALQRRLLEGADIGARRLEDVISKVSTQFNPLSIGQSIGQGLQGQRAANINALGSLFQIGASNFGQQAQSLGAASDIGAREAQRLTDLRLGTATRTSDTSGSSFDFGFGG